MSEVEEISPDVSDVLPEVVVGRLVVTRDLLDVDSEEVGSAAELVESEIEVKLVSGPELEDPEPEVGGD